MTNYIHSGNFESIKAFIQDSFGTYTGAAGRTSYNYIDEAKSFGIASSSEPFAIGTMVLPTDSGATFNNHWHWAVSKSKKAMILWTQTTNPLTSGNCAVSAVLAQDTHGIWHVFYYNIKAGADFSADRIVPVDYYYNTPDTDKIAMNILQIGGSAGSPNILSPCFNIDGEAFDELFKVEYSSIYFGGSPSVLVADGKKYIAPPYPYCYDGAPNTTAFALLVE